MKKRKNLIVPAVLVVLILSFTLCACGQSDTTQTSAENGNEQTTDNNGNGTSSGDEVQSGSQPVEETLSTEDAQKALLDAYDATYEHTNIAINVNGVAASESWGTQNYTVSYRRTGSGNSLKIRLVETYGDHTYTQHYGRYGNAFYYCDGSYAYEDSTPTHERAITIDYGVLGEAWNGGFYRDSLIELFELNEQGLTGKRLTTSSGVLYEFHFSGTYEIAITPFSTVTLIIRDRTILVENGLIKTISCDENWSETGDSSLSATFTYNGSDTISLPSLEGCEIVHP